MAGKVRAVSGPHKLASRGELDDVILRVAVESRFQVIDLRLVCTEPADYANPIEPSSTGGAKIARAIIASLALTEDPIEHSQVFF